MKTKKISKKLNFLFQSITFKLLFYLILIVFIATIFIFAIETQNKSFSSIFDAFWYVIVTLTTVGYGDIVPQTAWGKWIGIFTIISGVALVALATGQLASILIEVQLKKGRGLMKLKRIQNHLIICGWKSDFISFLHELLNNNPELEPDDIVLVNNESQELMQTVLADPDLAKINYIHGEYFDDNILRRAKINSAKKIIVLADDTGRYSPSEIDSKTVMTVLTVESINKSIYISAELFDPKFQKYLERSHCDEIILSKEFSKKLIINSAKGSGFSHIIEELLSPKKDTQLLTIDFPDKFINKPYKELYDYFKNRNELLIGMLEYTGNFYLRKKEAILEAQKTPDISKLVENLKDIKKLRGNEPVLNPDDNYIIKKYSKAIILGKSKIISEKEEEKENIKVR